MALRISLWLALLWLPAIHRAYSSPASSFRLQHRYSEQEGSSKRGGMSSEHFQQLRSHDRARHARVLAGAASFPLGGTADPTVAGLYFTELNIGTPPSQYYVQVDTGSDLLWLNCVPCNTCPTSTNLGVHLQLYDPDTSKTNTRLTCEDKFCNLASSSCESGQLCGYELLYGDGSMSKGYFVEDSLHLELVVGNQSVNSDNATVVFGCGTSQSGGLQQQDQALDGILGLGQSNMSIIQQLASQGKTTQIFAHCLEGESKGGGILVIGNVTEPGLVYTPIVKNQPHYNVNLQSIDVNGQSLKVDSSFYSTGQNQGTIIDSGTTLAYIAEPAYQLLLQEILVMGPNTLPNHTWEDMTCILYDGSLDDVFPSVTFNFEGGAAMTVKPNDYFIQAQISTDNVYCIGFQNPTRNNLDVTILGDLVLKDKLVVYDLDKQQIGWVNYNCSSNVTIVSSTGESEKFFASAIGNPSRASGADSLRTGTCFAILLLLYITMGL